jgi:hypothetical protein
MNSAEFWKAELWRETSRLREALEQQGLDYFAAKPEYVERYAFVTAYEMRKLDEAEALTTDLTEHEWDVLTYPAINRPNDTHGLLLRQHGRGWRVALDQHYDLDRPTLGKLKHRYLCNRFVHHLVFDVRQHSTTGALEMLFADRDHSDTLYGITLDTYIEVVLEAHYDEIRWLGVTDEGQRIRRRQRPPF